MTNFRWNDVSLSTKLRLALSTLLLLGLGLGGSSLLASRLVKNDTFDITDNWIPCVRNLSTMQVLLADIRADDLRLGAEPEAAIVQELATRKERARTEFKESQLVYYYATVMGGSVHELDVYRHMAADVERYTQLSERMQELAFKGGPAAAQELRIILKGDTEHLYEAGRKGLDELLSINYSGMMDSTASLNETQESTQGISLLLLCVVFAVGGALCVWLPRVLLSPLNRAIEIARTVANGDLTSRIEPRGRDETGQLLSVLKEMNGKLVGLLRSVRNASEQVAASSTEIASGNADLSTRTEAQASSIQQTAAAMNELTETVSVNAAHAEHANQAANAAADAAANGARLVDDVVQTMDEISRSSKQIQEIIAVIDGISFQTNILALNAAVEAARAGDLGRGFAVVASEVRALAQRSATAAREIKGLIGKSVTCVQAGSEQVTLARESMASIVNHANMLCNSIGEISTATEYQTVRISEVRDAVTQFDGMTQQNAALVEESAASAEWLRTQAKQLASMMGDFRLETA